MSALRTGLLLPSSLYVLLTAPLADAAQAPADSAAALAGLREFSMACRRDAGRIWGRSLCGPLIAVDDEAGRAYATEPPPRGRFSRQGTL